MTKAPPRRGRLKEIRIIKGVSHNVITEHGKIVEDLGPVKRYYHIEEEMPQVVNNEMISDSVSGVSEEQEHSTGLQLVDEKDVLNNRMSPVDTRTEDLIKSKELLKGGEEDNQQYTKDNNVHREQKPVSTKKQSKVPTWEEILGNIPEPDPDKPNSEEIKVPEQEIKVPEQETKVSEPEINIPKIQIEDKVPESKPQEIKLSEPEIKIPKVQIKVPEKRPQEIKAPKFQMNIPKIGIGTNMSPNIYNSTTAYPKSKKVGTELRKAEEVSSSQLPGIVSNKLTTENKIPTITKEKRRSMAEELEAELLSERKFEEWLKKQKFRENLEKAAKFAEETKEQFEEKIPELSGKIESVTGEVRNVENKLGAVDDRLGTVDKSIGTLCTGIDCVKEDVKKYQTSQQALERLVQERFQELGEKVQGLENPMFTCENCGEQKIRPLDSYCPNCGSPIHSWSDEEGQPIRGWSPYWKRIGRVSP